MDLFLSFYPNGSEEAHKDNVSVYLRNGKLLGILSLKLERRRRGSYWMFNLDLTKDMEFINMKLQGEDDTIIKWTTTIPNSKFNCKVVFSIEIEHWIVNQHYSLDLEHQVIKNCQAKSQLQSQMIHNSRVLIQESDNLNPIFFEVQSFSLSSLGLDIVEVLV